jgi:hypothetical protein
LRAASVSNNSVCALRISQCAFRAPYSFKSSNAFSCNLKAASHFADEFFPAALLLLLMVRDRACNGMRRNEISRFSDDLLPLHK